MFDIIDTYIAYILDITFLGVANTKQCAKRKAARCMLNLVCDIDMETLNQVKQETNIIVPEEVAICLILINLITS